MCDVCDVRDARCDMCDADGNLPSRLFTSFLCNLVQDRRESLWEGQTRESRNSIGHVSNLIVSPPPKGGGPSAAVEEVDFEFNDDHHQLESYGDESGSQLRGYLQSR